jgi:hypothetical protein
MSASSSTSGPAFFAASSTAIAAASATFSIASATPPGGKGRGKRKAGGAGRSGKRKADAGSTIGADSDDDDNDDDDDDDKKKKKADEDPTKRIRSHFLDDPSVMGEPDAAHRQPSPPDDDDLADLDMSNPADAERAAEIAAEIEDEATAEAQKKLVYEGTKWAYGDRPYTVLHVIQVRMKMPTRNLQR